jgi:hypothetical protein
MTLRGTFKNLPRHVAINTNTLSLCFARQSSRTRVVYDTIQDSTKFAVVSTEKNSKPQKNPS